ncbi:MAG TPA: hypothetical protein VL442_00125 [Mucilaginibacter sp.]|jgi:hypothetical protein|nr:hypothetical protein [Mucilaginibacter sp.]
MKLSSKKLINKPGVKLPGDVPLHEADIVAGSAAIQMPSSHSVIFAECYDALLWMNGNVKQLHRMLDLLI